jgi:DUF4097 and DUF4098 domain-containing protein YvlB
MTRRCKALATLLAVAVLSAAPAQAGGPIDQTADAHPRGEVDIANTAGQIWVTGWDREQVQVTGELGADAEELRFVADGRRTEIKVILPRGSSRRGSSDLQVMVPSGSSVSIQGVSSEVRLREVYGALRIETVSGEIDVEVYEDDVEVRTISGSVTVRGHDEPALLVLNTVSGDGEISDVRGELVVHSVTGDLDITSKELERARLRTTNGDIDLRTALTADARFDMEAINGDLRLDIIGGVNADFDIETFNGSINNDFGPEAEAASRYTPGKSLRFTEGDGGARVRIKTLNGTISLRNR